ncbi:MAG: AsmA-like C-terminal region-containing protein [Flavobacteriales bacterium]
MSKWLKRIVLTIVILFVLLIAAAIIIPIAFKDKIEARVKEEVNKNLNATVDWGEWDISLISTFPNLGVSVANVKVCNNAPFEGICLADIGELQASVGLMSLFGDRIEIKKIGLTKPDLHVKVLEDGRANWDIAKADSSAAVDPADTGATAFNIALKEYWITDGHLIYDDASLPYSMELAGLDHNGSGDFTQDLFVLKTVTHSDTVNVVFDGVKYLKNVKADITADLDMDMANMKFTFKDNEATINQLVLGFNGWLSMPGDDMVMDLTWNTKKNDLATLLSLVPAEFAGDLKGVDMSGKAAFDGFVKGTFNENTMPGFGLNISVDNGRFKYASLPESVEDIQVRCAIKSPEGKDLDGMTVDLSRFDMRMAGNPISAHMFLKTPISDPDVDAELKAQLDLASLKKVVPMEKGDDLKGSLTADVRMKGRMSAIEKEQYDQFQADGTLKLMGIEYKTDSLPTVGINGLYFTFSPQFLSLDGFDGTIGTSDLKAKGRLDNYIAWWLKDSTLTGSFDVTSNKFDLNELMGEDEASSTTPAAEDTAAMSVIEVPKNLDFRMGLAVKQVLYDNMTLDNCKGSIHLHDQRVDMRDVFFNALGGGITLNGGYETTDPAKPTIDFAYGLKDLDIEETVKYVETVQKVVPIAKTCTGKFSSELKMTGVLGPDMMPIMESLVGDGKLRTKTVAIEGFQPLIDLAKALKLTKLENTVIDNIDFSYHFKDGKMITDKFPVQIDKIKAKVGGSTAFADQAIDYDMDAKVPTEMFGSQAASAVGGLLGQLNNAVGSNFEVPKELDLTCKITGTITKPIVKPVFAGGSTNVKETVVAAVKETVNAEIGKAKEEAIAKAREEAAKLVAEAQKQADALKAQARTEAAKLKTDAYKAADAELAKVTNPLAKIAAKLVCDEAKKGADKKEQQYLAEADKKADGLVVAAQKQGDAIVKKAEDTNTTVK